MKNKCLILWDGLQNLMRHGHLRILVVCCVANPRDGAAIAAVCASQSIQNRSARFPQQVLQTILCIWMLSGCWHALPPAPEAMQPLLPIHAQEYPQSIKFLEYSANGQALLLAAPHCRQDSHPPCVSLHHADGYRKMAGLTFEDIKKLYAPEKVFDKTPSISIRSAGFLEANIWYLALEDGVVSIRQFAPERELLRHHFAGSILAANHQHLAGYSALLDWRSGKTFATYARTGHPSGDCTMMTQNSQVMSCAANHDGHILIHDPWTQKDTWLHTGHDKPWHAPGFFPNHLPRFFAAIAPDGGHVLTVSSTGKCSLWSVAEGKKPVSCGSGVQWLGQRHSFRPDGRSFMVWAKGGLREYAVPSLALLRTIPMKKEWATRVQVNQDWLAAVDRQGRLRAWKLQDGRLIGIYEGDGEISPFESLIFALQPGGSHLALVQDGQWVVLDLAAMP